MCILQIGVLNCSSNKLPETTQMVTSVNWYSRESRNWVRTESTSRWLWRWSHWLVGGKTKQTKLEFSGWDLHPYILLHVFVHICTGSTNDCSRIFRYLVAWGGSVHQARPWNGREVEHDVTAWQWAEWKRRQEGHSHALHGDEWSEECMRHGEMKREA